jgi:hypothetical protein
MDALTFLFDPANRGWAVTTLVVIGLILWFIFKDPVGRWMDKDGKDGGLAKGFWGALSTVIVVAIIGFVVMNVVNADVAWTYAKPVMTVAQAEADARKDVLGDNVVKVAQANAETAKANAEAGHANSEALAYTTGDPVRALAPAWQVLQAETDKLLAPTQKFETVKTDTQTNYKPVEDPATGAVTLVPTGQTEQKSTTTRTADPLMLLIILGVVGAVASAWGRKS